MRQATACRPLPTMPAHAPGSSRRRTARQGPQSKNSSGTVRSDVRRWWKADSGGIYLGGGFCSALNIMGMYEKGTIPPIRSFVSSRFAGTTFTCGTHASPSSLQCREKKEKESEPELRPTDRYSRLPCTKRCEPLLGVHLRHQSGVAATLDRDSNWRQSITSTPPSRP